MTAVLYRWPQAAGVGTVVPKKKFYAQPHVTAAVRERFVAEVERITWAYKLAESTLNLPGDDAVPEIEVFVLDAKGEDISDGVLAAIDRAIPKPLLFEIARSVEPAGVRLVAAPKQLGHGVAKVGSYSRGAWHPTDAERHQLPPAITLAGLYAALLASVTGLSARPGEDVGGMADRLDAGRRLEREIVTLERKLRNEPQLNRKIELRKQIKERTALLTELTDPVPSNKE